MGSTPLTANFKEHFHFVSCEHTLSTTEKKKSDDKIINANIGKNFTLSSDKHFC